MTERVAVIAAHPEDEVLGCGGTIAKLAAGGHDVRVIYLTSGESASGSVPEAQLGPLRESEARDAVTALGAESAELVFLRIIDGLIHPHDHVQVAAVIRLLRQIRPALLYLPHAGDSSFDHLAAHKLVMRAATMAGRQISPGLGKPHWIPTILGYEARAPISCPVYYEDITPHATAKQAALACYASQISAGDSQSSQIGPAGLALAVFRGAVTGGGCREAFSVLRLGQVLP